MQTQILKDLRALGTQIHKGSYPKKILHSLGKEGFYQSFFTHKEQGLWDAIESIYTVSKTCGNTGFCAWCQNALAWYLLHSQYKEEQKGLFLQVSKGEILGGTGLSNPIKSFVGIEKIRLRAVKTQGGYVINGALPWVSNIGFGHYFGVIARVDSGDTNEKKARFVMGLIACDERVELKQSVHFAGLEGSGTFSVALKDYFIKDSMLIAHSWEEVATKIMPGFVLMQAGLGLGLLDNALEILNKQIDSTNGINAFVPFYGTHKNLESFYKKREEIFHTAKSLSATPYNANTDFFHTILALKRELANTLLEASSLVMLCLGTKGYMQDSYAIKLLLESYFVSIVTPSTKHITKILQKD